MASIDDLKTLLNFRFSDGRKKLACEVEPRTNFEQNMLMLFYNGDNETVAAAHTVEDGFYSTGIQVAVRHAVNSTARIVAFKAHKYLNANKKTKSGVWWYPVSPPAYQGIDDRGGEVWAFDIRIKGDE